MCLKLCADAPNFETEGPQSTFRIFLIKYCENEFKSRNNENQDPVTRQKCLGNLRFIAELGIRGVMPPKILHDCVQELLSKRSRSSNSSTNCSESRLPSGATEAQTRKERALAADIECLCQFLTIVGKFMDSPKARNLMDQYFHRLRRLLERSNRPSGTNDTWENTSLDDRSPQGAEDIKAYKHAAKCNEVCALPARIRFMIEDLIDLRENNWIPRHAGQQSEVNKPRFLRDIRMEILKESGTLVAPTPSERSISRPNVPGSGFTGYTSTCSSSSSLNNNVPFVSAAMKGNHPNVNEAKNWMELTRMGEELCRSGYRDMGLFSSGVSRSSSDCVNEHPYGRHINQVLKRHTNHKLFDSGTPSGVNGNGNNIRSVTRINSTDLWSIKMDKTDDSGDLGWIRGVAGRLNYGTNIHNNNSGFINTSSNSNLPPRMLRKLAAEAAGSSLDSKDSSSNLRTDDPYSSKINSSGAERVGFFNRSGKNSSNANAVSREDRSPAVLDLFQPAYLQKSSIGLDGTASRKLKSTDVISSPITSNGDVRTSHQPIFSNLKSQPVNSLAPQNSSSFPVISPLSTTHASKSTIRKPESNDFPNSSTHPTENQLSTSSTRQFDENRRTAFILLTLFEESKCLAEIASRLHSSALPNSVNIESFALFILHLCEEATDSPLDLFGPMELTASIVYCANSLFTHDNRSIKEHNKSCTRLLRNDHLATIWSHLLCKTLMVTSLSYSKSKLALLSAYLVWNNQLHLSDLKEPLRNGKHHPLFLLVLQKLTQMADEPPTSGTFNLTDVDLDVLSVNEPFTVCILGDSSEQRRRSLMRLFRSSGLKLNQMMPDGNNLNDALLALLEERKLTFLVPNLRLTNELSTLLLERQKLGSDYDTPSNELNDKRISSLFADHLENKTTEEDRQWPEFVHACFSFIYAYVYQIGLVEMGGNSSSKELLTRERMAWQTIVPAQLMSVLRDSSELQLEALHALQIFWSDKNMPKGFLLRCFMNLYDCELVGEDTFLAWKEEVNLDYPVKGQALFEVNRWLTWLETAEEEDEDEHNDQALTGSEISSHAANGQLIYVKEKLVNLPTSVTGLINSSNT